LAEAVPVICVAGAESLLGREVIDVLATRNLPAHVKHAAAIEDEEKPGGIITVQEGEAVLVPTFNAADLAGSSVVLLAGAPESAARAAMLSLSAGDHPTLIDLTGALEDNPAARLRAPMVESVRETATIYVIAHPAAIAMALFLKQLSKAGVIRRIVANIFEPVSERGKKGLDELRQQTVALLSFQKLKQDVFDTQVSYNLLPRYGPEAARPIEDVEAAVERHIATLLSSETAIPMPSLRVVHAPVFHGYSMSLWVEFENRPDAGAIASVLAKGGIEVRGKDTEAPSNAGVAGQSGITIDAVTLDRNEPRACWFWIVADNLRIAAENAVEVARESLG
jgi:aspartate-semialdehyde dehydrogenase